jgi:hypothetical protein
MTNDLSKIYGFKLKSTGPIKLNLELDFFKDCHEIHCLSAKKYDEKMMSSYQQFFASKPSSKFTSPLEKGDHPEFDASELLDETETKRYQSLIVALHWAITI